MTKNLTLPDDAWHGPIPLPRASQRLFFEGPSDRRVEYAGTDTPDTPPLSSLIGHAVPAPSARIGNTGRVSYGMPQWVWFRTPGFRAGQNPAIVVYDVLDAEVLTTDTFPKAPPPTS